MRDHGICVMIPVSQQEWVFKWRAAFDLNCAFGLTCMITNMYRTGGYVNILVWSTSWQYHSLFGYFKHIF